MPADLPPSWIDLLRSRGYRPGPVLGAGMEGTVVELADDLVVKLWLRRTTAELEVLRCFDEALASAGLPFGTPRIVEVLELDGRCATVEARLHGRPLLSSTGGDRPVPDETAVRAVTDVLAGLAAVAPTPALAALPVLEGEAPFAVDGSFGESLAGLVERRVARSHGPLLARLPDVDVLAAACVRLLRGLPVHEVGLIHGDLIPANILVDASGRPTAVLDVGFLTTVGDPAFDAAVTASIVDMYGAHAAETERVVDAAVAERFGYPAERLATYRAAYALVTSTCYGASGSDGHFEWCVRMLERAEVRDVLGV